MNALGATAALRSTRIASRRPGTNIFVRSAAPAGATAIAPTQPLAIHPSGLLPYVVAIETSERLMNAMFCCRVQFNSFNRTAVLLDPNFYAAQAQAAPTAAYTQIHAAGYDIPQMVQPVWVSVHLSTLPTYHQFVHSLLGRLQHHLEHRPLIYLNIQILQLIGIYRLHRLDKEQLRPCPAYIHLPQQPSNKCIPLVSCLIRISKEHSPQPPQ